MSRYIDADDLIKSIDKEIFTNPTTRSYFKQIVYKQPTADVVEVVRCNDCKHWGGVAFGGVCRKYSGCDTKVCTDKDHFCSYGERREE